MIAISSLSFGITSWHTNQTPKISSFANPLHQIPTPITAPTIVCVADIGSPKFETNRTIESAANKQRTLIKVPNKSGQLYCLEKFTL